jgi:hypothetical protein
MVAAGLITWFATLTVLVRFIPNRIGPTFFRLVNFVLGLILLGFATFCAVVLFRHYQHPAWSGIVRDHIVGRGPYFTILLKRSYGKLSHILWRWTEG